MKRTGCFLFAIMLCLLCTPAWAEELPHIGVCIYNAADTFITSIQAEIQRQAQDAATLTVYDSSNDQNTQNDQIKQLLQDGVDALIINAVDRTAAVYLCQMAMQSQTPLIFINREPLPEDLALYDKAYYVGTNPQETGRLCGQLVVDYFHTHPQADLNGDGVIQYVLLKGEPGHQDAEFRTTYSIKAIQDAGFRLEKLAEDNALWERSLGQEKMAAFLAAFGTKIECVISNNDDMALGAIDALKAAGYFSGGKTMPVVGVDATKPALEALQQHSLLGTVLNDSLNQGRAAFKLALLLAKGEAVEPNTFEYAVDVSRHVWIPSHQITLQTLEEQK